MKILILSQYWSPENGVPQRRWNWLTGLLKDGNHDITVIAPRPHYERDIGIKTWFKKRYYRASTDPISGPSGERIIRSGFIPSNRSLLGKIFNQSAVALGAIWVIAKKPGFLSGYKPDLIIGTVPALPTAAVTFIASHSFNAPYLIDLRDAWPHLLTDRSDWNRGVKGDSHRQRPYLRALGSVASSVVTKVFYALLRKASVITVTSSYLGRELRTRSELHSRGRGAPAVFTIRNVFGTQTEVSGERRPPAGQRPLRVLYAGTIGRAQNLENAVLAASICKTRGTEVELCFVGSGVAKNRVESIAKQNSVPACFVSRQKAEDLAEFYMWADTALVHLTDWKALEMVVPSKTYELMELGIHITAVATGETADLVSSLAAGDVVSPEDPESLAALWMRMQKLQHKPFVSPEAADWIKQQRTSVAPATLKDAVNYAIERGRE